MNIEKIIKEKTAQAISALYTHEIKENSVQTQSTRKDVTGDLTVVIFPFLRFSGKNPVQTGNEIGEYLIK
ncbi:MAG: arginine--tRNA ligase, partial [Prolixibacteraceae bacterium]|nr:arginine--tRNA ligase [Prolixibacteraceae bacterium]